MAENPFAPILQAFEGVRQSNVQNAQLSNRMAFESDMLTRKLTAEREVAELRLKGDAQKQMRDMASKNVDQMVMSVTEAAKANPVSGIRVYENLVNSQAGKQSIRGYASVLGITEGDLIARLRVASMGGVTPQEAGSAQGAKEGAAAVAAAPGKAQAETAITQATTPAKVALAGQEAAARTQATVANTPQTDAAKLVLDQKLVEGMFGKDSPQSRAFVEAAAAKTGPKLTDERGMRQEFTKASGEFVAVRDAFNRVSAATQTPSAAGDLALIFNFMKMLDPSSVVREGEFATAQNAASVPDRIRNVYNKVISGERMNPDQRADFVGQAENLFKVQLRTQRNLEKQFRGLAVNSRIDPANVVLDFVGGEIREAGGLPPAAVRQRAVLGDGTVLEVRDGKWVPVPK